MDFIERAQSLEDAMAISYSGKPEFEATLCNSHLPFKCYKIKKDLMGRKYYELLAIKNAV